MMPVHGDRDLLRKSGLLAGGRWLAAALLLHVFVIGLALWIPAAPPMTPPAPFSVEMITPAAPQSNPVRPQPRPSQTVAPKVPPIAKEPAPSALTTTTPIPAAEPAVVPASKSVPANPGTAELTQPVVQPRFDAAYLNNPLPSYPTLSKRLNEQGKVEVRVHVTTAGLPDQVELKKTSGYPRLDNAAMEAIKHWRFVPARQGSETVAAWVIVPMPFTLEN